MDKLILIISQPRSGSTLLLNLLQNHPKIIGGEEFWLLLPLLSFFKPDLHNASYNSDLAFEAITRYLDKNKAKEKFDTEFRNFIEKTYEDLLKGKSYIIDKTPRYYEIVFEISRLLPDARIIVVQRNPLDVLVSIINTWKIKKFDELYFYRRDLLVAPIKLKSFVDSKHHSDNVRVIRYEDLVINPTDNLSSILGWVGLNFDKKFLEIKPDTYKFGDPSFNQTVISPNSVNQWESFLKNNPKWKEFFFGYSYFLNHNGINNYDLPSVRRSTQVFETFNRFCRLRDSDADDFKTNFRRIMNNIFIKVLNTLH